LVKTRQPNQKTEKSTKLQLGVLIEEQDRHFSGDFALLIIIFNQSSFL
jgi:hypothetical protein